MGIFDFVRNGVREMAIARPDDNGDLIYKHPDRTIPMFAQCTVRADEWAVFAKEGRPMGTLDAGRHTLQAQNIPFLSNLVDSFTGGNVFLAEAFFVKRTPFPMRFGGSLGNMIDPMTQIRIRGRCHGELLLRVENPERLIFGYFGMRKFQDHPDIFNWLTDAFFMTVKTTLGKFAREQRRTLVDIMDMTTELSNWFVQNASDLAEVGIRIVKVTKLEIDVPEEDLKRFDEMRQKVAEQMVGLQVDEIAIQRAALQAQADVARSQVGVQKAQFDAQAKQFQLDQQYQQDSRYVQNLAGNYQNYAAGQAMIGAGQGMAQPGQNTGAAGAGVQMGVGMGVAAMYANAMQQPGLQFRGVGPTAGAFPPGVAPPPPPPMAPPPPPPMGRAVFHVQFAEGVVQIEGADAVRGEIGRRGLDPAAVMLWTNGMPAWGPAAAVLAAMPSGDPPPPPPPPPPAGPPSQG